MPLGLPLFSIFDFRAWIRSRKKTPLKQHQTTTKIIYNGTSDEMSTRRETTLITLSLPWCHVKTTRRLPPFWPFCCHDVTWKRGSRSLFQSVKTFRALILGCGCHHLFCEFFFCRRKQKLVSVSQDLQGRYCRLWLLQFIAWFVLWYVCFAAAGNKSLFQSVRIFRLGCRLPAGS